MDAIILFDYKAYEFTCDSCDWVGTELELDVVSKIDMNLVCCPLCQSDDVRVLNDNNEQAKAV
jgi:Zn finger protein HypA/HybF involved in hydrogenase expression